MIQGFKHTFHRTGQQKQKYIGSRVKGLKYLGHNLRQVLNKKEKSFLTLNLFYSYENEFLTLNSDTINKPVKVFNFT